MLRYAPLSTYGSLALRMPIPGLGFHDCKNGISELLPSFLPANREQLEGHEPVGSC